MNKREKREYNTIHQWRLRNKKKLGKCQCCKSIRETDWASKRRVYIRDDSEWFELCYPCHAFYDNRVIKQAYPFKSIIPPYKIIYPYNWRSITEL